MKRIPSMFNEEIKELLKQGFRPYQIANQLKLNKISTSSYIKIKFNLNFSRTHYIKNPDYFHNIDSYMKAYWLGFITADGYLTNNPSKVVGIQLQEKDKNALDNLKLNLGTEKPLLKIKSRILNTNNKTYICKPMYRFTIGSSEMFDDLNRLGITQNKSKTVPNVIKNIPYKYRNSFIVGYFDGDGTTGLPKGKVKVASGIWYPSHSVHVSARGTKQLLQGILDHLEIDRKLYFDKTYILSLTQKEQVIKFLMCYNNLNFFLRRKHDKLISRLNHVSYDKFIQAQTISSPYPYKEK